MKMAAMAAGFKAFPPRPYTVSVGKATRPPSVSTRAALIIPSWSAGRHSVWSHRPCVFSVSGIGFSSKIVSCTKRNRKRTDEMRIFDGSAKPKERGVASSGFTPLRSPLGQAHWFTTFRNPSFRTKARFCALRNRTGVLSPGGQRPNRDESEGHGDAATQRRKKTITSKR